MIALEDIQRAAGAIAGWVHQTPLLTSQSLSDRAGARVLIKAECFQRTGSFKARGVFNKIFALTDAERERGLIGVSAGNHAQAMAYAATRVGVRCTVVMPETASPVKVAASRAYGAEVVQHGDVFQAWQRMEELREAHGYSFVHPYDDPVVIAGQGTAGIEILTDLPAADVIVVPVGGGGLISGIATAAKALAPGVRVYGVEPEGADGMSRALRAGAPVRLPRIDTIADGLGAPGAGEQTLQHVQAFVDAVVLVDDAAIRAALGYVLERVKIMIEPAAAAGFAALLSGKIPVAAGQNVVIVASGGNMDLARLKELL